MLQFRGLGFEGAGSWDYALGFRLGLGFGVQGLGFWVKGLM